MTLLNNTHTYTAPFITFEGGEGAGKTTQIKMLSEWLQKDKGVEVVATREPGGTKGALEIRKLLTQEGGYDWDVHTDTLLFMAARRDNLSKVVWPALREGKWVISDRFNDSTIAYQCFGRGLAMDDVMDVYRFVAQDFMPQTTLFLDIDPKLGLERVMAGASDRNMAETRYEKFDFSFHEKLRQGYKTLAEQNPERMIIIDAARSVEEVQADIRHIISSRHLA